MSHARDETLAVLAGRPSARLPVFSGLPSLTASGLAAAGIRYGETHTDAGKMARAAASTFERFGFESAVVPFDLCVEAEALGCGVDFHAAMDTFLPPMVDAPLEVHSALAQLAIPEDVTRAGRIPLVAEAVRRLKAGVGQRIAIGALVPGPFTLAWQLFGTDNLMSELRNEGLGTLLARLGGFLARVATCYREAGADFITVHEMGGSPQVIGARTFRAVVMPALIELLKQLPRPSVLSMCGNTNAVVADLAGCGADALNFDHLNDLALTRQRLGPQAVLLGNFDPVATLSQGTPELIAKTVADIAQAGASAIWPGCDLWPEIPDENFAALMESAQRMRRDDRPATSA